MKNSMGNRERLRDDIERQSKACSNCLVRKSFTEFHKNARCQSGHHSICKECRCVSEYQRQLTIKLEDGAEVENCIDCDMLFTPTHKKHVKCIKCR